MQESKPFDVLIIGGGINGVSIALEAASRGLSTALVEQGDLAEGTSSHSSKLIHGGLRYLEQADFRLVTHALREREVWLKRAPHLVQPLEFILPHEIHLRPKWLLRTGLWLYDHLSRRITLPASKSVTRNDSPFFTPLKPFIQHGFSYYDCYCNDTRLAISIAMRAREWGAHIQTRMRCVHAKPQKNLWSVVIEDQHDGSHQHYLSRCLVNASGPWMGEVSQQIERTQRQRIQLVKGSHIVVPALYPGNHAYILQNKDRRIVFVIPFENHYSLIGTTDVAFHGKPEEAHISPEEMDYLFAVVNHYFQASLYRKDILWQFSAVRPLLQEERNDPSKISRDYEIIECLLPNLPPLLSIAGGKITTARRLGYECIQKLSPHFHGLKPSCSHEDLLPGAWASGHNFSTYIQQQKTTSPHLPTALIQRWIRSYGSRCEILLEHAQKEGLGEHLGADLYTREVDYLKDQEWAETAEDILYRRSKLGLIFTAQEKERLRKYLTLTHNKR